MLTRRHFAGLFRIRTCASQSGPASGIEIAQTK